MSALVSSPVSNLTFVPLILRVICWTWSVCSKRSLIRKSPLALSARHTRLKTTAIVLFMRFEHCNGCPCLCIPIGRNGVRSQELEVRSQESVIGGQDQR